MDRTKHKLGKLCRNGHEATPGSQQSWRYVVKGRMARCVECSRQAKARYAHSEKGKVSAQKANAKYRSSEKGRLRDERAACVRNTEEGKEKVRLRNSAYSASPQGSVKKKVATTRYRKSEKGRQTRRNHQREYQKQRRQKDASFALVQRLRCRLGAAFRLYSAEGKIKTADEYGVDYEAILKHLGPCPGPRSEWHIDHIRPLSSFDWDDPATPAAAFAPENHQWLLEESNLSKGSSWPITEL